MNISKIEIIPFCVPKANLIITEEGYKLLGKHKTIEDVENQKTQED